VPERTKIVFCHGEEVAVHAPARKVRRRLDKDRRAGQTFTKLKSDHDTDVFVAVGQVAYIEQVADGVMRTPLFAKTRSRELPSGVRRSSPNGGVRRDGRRGVAP
jgi:hypothetical protein